MTRVLVTGASGTIGRPLTTALAGAGYAVRAAVRERRAQEFPHGVEVVPLPDLAGPVDWPPLVAGIDMIVHLAGIAHVGPDVSAENYDRVNHVASAELARAAASAGVRRFVFVSSIRAQSAATADHRLGESDPARPTEAYGRSKLAAEQAVRAAGMPYTVLRPVLVYGPGATGNLANLIWLAGLPLPLPFGWLTKPRSLLSVDNLIAAIRFALDDARAENETFIVADPAPVSVADIISICRGAAGRGPGLFALPPRLLAILFGATGQREKWNRLAGSLLAPPAKLMAAGWRPAVDTKLGLTALVRQRPNAEDA